MINTFSKIFFILLVAILQFVLLPILSIKGTFPNLILIAAVVLIILDFESDAFLVAGLGGLILDIGGPIIFGYNIVFNILAIFLIRFLMRRFLTQANLLSISIITLLIQLVYSFLSNLILRHQISNLIFIESLYGLVFGVVFFLILATLHKQTQIIKIGAK